MFQHILIIILGHIQSTLITQNTYLKISLPKTSFFISFSTLFFIFLVQTQTQVRIIVLTSFIKLSSASKLKLGPITQSLKFDPSYDPHNAIFSKLSFFILFIPKDPKSFLKHLSSQITTQLTFFKVKLVSYLWHKFRRQSLRFWYFSIQNYKPLCPWFKTVFYTKN